MSDGLQIFGGAADAGPGNGDAADAADTGDAADTADTGDAADTADTGDTAEDHDEAHAKRRPRWPGGLAGGIAILMVLTWALGLVALTNGMFELGLGLSVSAVLLSGLAVIGGIVAVIGNWGRGWGIAAIAVGVLLNPVVLTYILGTLGAV